jgi:hypothetical protein
VSEGASVSDGGGVSDGGESVEAGALVSEGAGVLLGGEEVSEGAGLLLSEGDEVSPCESGEENCIVQCFELCLQASELHVFPQEHGNCGEQISERPR